jgi:hypothetical protein
MQLTTQPVNTKNKQKLLILVFSTWLLWASVNVVWGLVAVGQEPKIILLQPAAKGGIGYQVSYYVDVPLNTYWRFKTDFDNSFLLTNQYIKAHKLIGREGNAIITENRYSFGPDAVYRWRTVVMNDSHRLEYELLNPSECGQKFHFGFIQARAEGQGTQVTQVAYLDFFGVSFWARYPWSGGLKDFLRNTIHWEQQTALNLEWRYATRKE